MGNRLGMRLFELRTATNKSQEITSLDAVQIIKNKCSDFLKIATNTNCLLFRGMDIRDIKIFIGEPHKNRNPLSNRIDFQNAFDKALTACNFTALRKNSIFCSNSIQTAECYGNVYAIFPFNGFDFTWSPKIEDAYSDIDEPLDLFIKELAKNPDLIKSKYMYTNTKFNLALKSSNEIIIKSEFLAVPYEDNQSWLLRLISK